MCRVNGAFSTRKQCLTGVPQGSCIGPLLWTVFANDVGEYIPRSVKYQIFADDIKVYHTIQSDEDCTVLQGAIDRVTDWASDNSMLLSESKCVVLKSKPHAFRYQIAGVLLDEPSSVRDLGVVVEPNLRFRKHIVDTARASSAVCNLILRTFIGNRADFYLTLYKAFVVSKLLYCSVIWSPHLSCEKALLERVQTRFLKFLSRRCGVEPASLTLPSIESLHRLADIHTFQSLVRNGEAANFFRITENSRRSRCTYDPITLGTNDTVNNLFAWRTARLLRNQTQTLEIKAILN